MNVVFRYSPLFKETFSKHKSQIAAKFQEFVKQKTDDPLAQFGSKDRHFTGDGHLSGFIHAGLTKDISIVYKRHGKNPTTIDLYAVATHAELGSGEPANLKIQKNMSKKMSNQEF